VFSALDKEDSPGCALAMVRHGKIIYERAYGMANLHCNSPITPKSNFFIAST
jgi:CubicO group peptidase (beta-lactamase class C family)